MGYERSLLYEITTELDEFNSVVRNEKDRILRLLEKV